MKRKLFSCIILLAVAALVFYGWKSGAITDILSHADELEEYTAPESVMGTGTYKYYYEHLGEIEKQTYAIVLGKIEEHPEKIHIPEITSEQLNEVFVALSYDNPEIICMGKGCKLVKEGLMYFFVPEYNESVASCMSHKKTIVAAAEQLASEAHELSTVYERELYIHDALISRSSYSDSDNFHCNTAYGVLADGLAACEGYSRAFQLVLGKCGIDSVLITGKAKNSTGNIEGHMWNAVNVDGAYYYCDLTWDDPVGESDVISHAYFNATGAMLEATHSDILPSEITCTTDTNNYFVKNRLYFNSASITFESRFLKAVGDAYIRGEDYVEVMFSDRAVYDKAVSKMLDHGLVRSAFELGGLIGVNEGFSMSYSENIDALTFRLYLS